MPIQHPILSDPEQCRKLRAEHDTILGAATALNCGENTVARWYRRHGIEWNHSRSTATDRKRRSILAELSEGISPELFDWPTREHERQAINREFMAAKRPQRVGVIADIHAPFQDRECLEWFLANERKLDYLVIAGDTLDQYAISRFHKALHVPLEREYRDAAYLLGKLAKRYPKVIITRANHELRLEKMLAAELTPEVFHQLKERIDILDLLLLRVKADNVTPHRNWWVQLGDAAICHAEEFSVVHGRSVTNVCDWFERMQPDIKVVVQAHSHHQSMLPYHGKLAIECGCTCHDMDYVMLQGRLGAHKKERWHRGYAVLQFDEKGACDWNRSGIKFYPS